MSKDEEQSAAVQKTAQERTKLSGDPNQEYCVRLAAEVFKRRTDPQNSTSKGSASESAFAQDLENDAKLQCMAAIESGFVPSKWLLEQEMRARKVEQAPPAEGQPDHANGRTACFEDEDVGREDVYKIAAEQQLTGVCFSGGGIRSATFNLGVLQGLAQLGLLPCIDYLSTVSGGGYIHEFVAAWILRNGEGLAGVEKALIPQAEPGCPPRAPEPIKWLQRYASYLTPRRGIFTTDTWTMIAIWFRNTVLNQIPIVASLGAVFFLLNLLATEGVKNANSFYFMTDLEAMLAIVAGVAITFFFVWSIMYLGLDLRRQTLLSELDLTENSGNAGAVAADGNTQAASQTPQHSAATEEEKAKKGKEIYESLLGNRKVQLHIILPWLAMAVWITYSEKLPWHWTSRTWIVSWAVCIVAASVIAGVVAFAGGAIEAWQKVHEDKTLPEWLVKLGFAGSAILAGTVACAIGYGFEVGVLHLAQWISSSVGDVIQRAQPATGNWIQINAGNLKLAIGGVADNLSHAQSGLRIDPWRVQIVILPALLLSVPYIAIELTLGLLGREYADTRREWLARMRAWSLLYGMLWIGLTSIALWGPYLVYFVWSKGLGAELSAAATLVISHLTTILAGSSGKSDGKPTSQGFLGYKPMDLLALAAAPIAILSFLILLSFGVDWLAQFLVQFPQIAWMGAFAWRFALVSCAVIFTLVAALFGWRLDINEFSMQSFYRNRLSRCYLGATTPERSPNPFTGFDMRSSLKSSNPRGHGSPPLVADLLPNRFNLLKKLEGEYGGPFPIFCTTLNLTTGEDLATQERKGTSFAFTPLYSGYSVGWTDGKKGEKVSFNGFVPTADYAYTGNGIHLDSAVAISGAAVNPNQGYNSNPALAFLMTFFNVRLGWWISNPRKTDMWRAADNRPTPKFALRYLLNELFGQANDRSNFVNLSDGGHFENMGLYELVRRRCKFIVVCDAEQDTDMKFCGIGIAINRCRADFGAEIDLDLRPLQIQQDGFSRAHCVVGTIQYPPPIQQPLSNTATATVCPCLGETADDLYKGTILYIKSSLAGDEPADILSYKLQHDTFPQDSTANQWFTETQFEGYRRLGHHITMTAIRPALPPDTDRVKHRREIGNLFESLYSIWYPPTPEMQQYLSQHIEQYQAILSELRERAELAGLAAALNSGNGLTGDVVPWSPPDAAGAQYAGQFANALLDFMYVVYTDLQLAFPDKRCSPHADWWLCLFRRWCRVSLLRDTWTNLTPIFAQEFQLFAKRELKLP